MSPPICCLVIAPLFRKLKSTAFSLRSPALSTGLPNKQKISHCCIFSTGYNQTHRGLHTSITCQMYNRGIDTVSCCTLTTPRSSTSLRLRDGLESSFRSILSRWSSKLSTTYLLLVIEASKRHLSSSRISSSGCLPMPMWKRTVALATCAKQKSQPTQHLGPRFSLSTSQRLGF